MLLFLFSRSGRCNDGGLFDGSSVRHPIIKTSSNLIRVLDLRVFPTFKTRTTHPGFLVLSLARVWIRRRLRPLRSPDGLSTETRKTPQEMCLPKRTAKTYCIDQRRACNCVLKRCPIEETRPHLNQSISPRRLQKT